VRDPQRRGFLAAAGWLGAGIAAGALAAGALLLAGSAVFDDDAPPEVTVPRFVEQAADAGLAHVYDGEFEFFVGGGVAVLDCDEDGRPDLYLAGGANPAALYRNASTTGGPLFFAEVPDADAALTSVVGAYPLDVDSDGHVDLAVLRLGENVMLRGDGACGFERANEAWGIDGGDEWTAGFSAVWEEGASLPTLAFGNYLDLAVRGQETEVCSDNHLVRPDGDRYGEPVTLSPGWCTLSILFSDWSRSGVYDLRMANDRHYYRDGEEQLWRIAPGEAPRLYTHDEGWRQMQIWGMGIASQDVTGDGVPEVFLTSQGDNKLQALEDGATGPAYTDIAIRRGVTAHRPFTGGETLPSTAWHPEFQDVNNDGLLDLFITKGNVEAQSDHAAADPNDLLLGRPDGTFAEAAADAGMLSFGRSRGAAVVDFDLDGLLDVVEVVRRDNVKLWRNLGDGTAASPSSLGNWAAVRLHQEGVNPDAVGAWVEVRAGDRTVDRQLTVGGGHAGGQLGWLHLGLGDEDAAEIRVQWPDGETGPWQEIEAGSHVIVERGASAPRTWHPPDG
jgi:enediyne biosynthesis protein E4